MTFDVVRGAAGFFLLVMQKSLNILDGSFRIPGVETMIRMTAGVGTTLSTQLAEETL
jgi:hypothetical protein